VFVKHRAIVNAVNARAAPLNRTLLTTIRPGDVNAGAASEVQSRVRMAFGSQHPLRMKRHFEVGSPYTYRLTPRENEGVTTGFARQNGDVFVFFDLQDREVLQVEAASLLGKQAPAVAAMAVDSDDEPGSGCCSPARSRSSTRDAGNAAPGKAEWYVADKGPIPYSELQLLWKYHLIPEDAPVRQGPSESTPIKEQSSHFSPAAQIQLVDPTILDEHGDMSVY
jgi:hypothetical protein